MGVGLVALRRVAPRPAAQWKVRDSREPRPGRPLNAGECSQREHFHQRERGELFASLNPDECAARQEIVQRQQVRAAEVNASVRSGAT